MTSMGTKDNAYFVHSWCDVNGIMASVCHELYGSRNFDYLKQCLAPTVKHLTWWHYRLLEHMSQQRFFKASYHLFLLLIHLYDNVTFDVYSSIFERFENAGIIEPRCTLSTLVLLSFLYRIYGDDVVSISRTIDSCRLANGEEEIDAPYCFCHVQRIVFNNRYLISYEFAHNFLRTYIKQERKSEFRARQLPPLKPQTQLPDKSPQKFCSSKMIKSVAWMLIIYFKTMRLQHVAMRLQHVAKMKCVLVQLPHAIKKRERKQDKKERQRLLQIEKEESKTMKKEHQAKFVVVLQQLVRKVQQMRAKAKQLIKIRAQLEAAQEKKRRREVRLTSMVIAQWKHMVRVCMRERFMHGLQAHVASIRFRIQERKTNHNKIHIVKKIDVVDKDVFFDLFQPLPPSLISPVPPPLPSYPESQDEKHETKTTTPKTTTGYCSETIYWNFHYLRFFIERIYIEIGKLFTIFRDQGACIELQILMAEHIRCVQTVTRPQVLDSTLVSVHHVAFDIGTHVQICAKLGETTFVNALFKHLLQNKKLEHYSPCISLIRNLVPAFTLLARTFRKIKNPTNAIMMELYDDKSRYLTALGNTICKEVQRKFPLFDGLWLLFEKNLSFAMTKWRESGMKEDIVSFLKRVQFAVDRLEIQKQKQRDKLTIHLRSSCSKTDEDKLD